MTCLPALETGQLSDLEGLVVLDSSLQVQQKLQDLSPLDTLRGIHILSGFGQAIHLVPNSPGLDALPDSTREVGVQNRVLAGSAKSIIVESLSL